MLTNTCPMPTARLLEIIKEHDQTKSQIIDCEGEEMMPVLLPLNHTSELLRTILFAMGVADDTRRAQLVSYWIDNVLESDESIDGFLAVVEANV